MTNSIRPYRLASLRCKGEAQTLPEGGEVHGAEGLGAKATMGAGRWLEKRARKVDCVKQGDLSGLQEGTRSRKATPAKQELQHS
jgi:hypothetical protein